MSDTPETDNLARGNHVVPTSWAQQLERERDEARKSAQQWRKLFFLMWAVAFDQPVPPDGKPPFPWEVAE